LLSLNTLIKMSDILDEGIISMAAARTPVDKKQQLVEHIKHFAQHPDSGEAEIAFEAAFKAHPFVDAEAADNDGLTPLMVAAKLGYLKAIKWLFNTSFFSKRRSPNISYTGKNNKTALCYAVQYKDLQDASADQSIMTKRNCIDFLIKKGASLATSNYKCVAKAAQKGNLYFIKKYFKDLIVSKQLGQHVSIITNQDGYTIISAAIHSKYVDILDYLSNMESHAVLSNINEPTIEKIKSELLRVISKNDKTGKKIYKILSKADSDYRINDYFLANKISDLNLVITLVNLGIAKLNEITRPKIFAAALKSKTDAETLFFLESVLFKDFKFTTAYAIDAISYPAVLEYLIEKHHVIINYEVICAAIQTKIPHEQIVFLLKHIDLTLPSNLSYYILQMVAAHNNYELIKLLLLHGASYAGRRREMTMPHNIRSFLLAHTALQSDTPNDLLIRQHLQALSMSEKLDLLALFQKNEGKTQYISYLISNEKSCTIENQSPEGEPSSEHKSSSQSSTPSSHVIIKKLMPVAVANVAENKEDEEILSDDDIHFEFEPSAIQKSPEPETEALPKSYAETSHSRLTPTK